MFYTIYKLPEKNKINNCHDIPQAEKYFCFVSPCKTHETKFVDVQIFLMLSALKGSSKPLVNSRCVALQLSRGKTTWNKIHVILSKTY